MKNQYTGWKHRGMEYEDYVVEILGKLGINAEKTNGVDCDIVANGIQIEVKTCMVRHSDGNGLTRNGRIEIILKNHRKLKDNDIYIFGLYEDDKHKKQIVVKTKEEIEKILKKKKSFRHMNHEVKKVKMIELMM